MKQKKPKALQIAIDGPAGAGKSTVAKLVAKRLNLFYVDTGAMYRAIAYKALKNQIRLEDEQNVSRIAEKTEVVLEHSDAGTVWCDRENVTQLIRSPEVTRAVSTVASYAGVRERLVELQRREAERGGVVMDGRDIGTYVLPEASLKIFLTAAFQERANRRWMEFRSAGKKVFFEEVAHDMQKRDRLDMEREISPLVPAKDAVILDTTDLSAEEIAAKIVALTKTLLKAGI